MFYLDDHELRLLTFTLTGAGAILMLAVAGVLIRVARRPAQLKTITGTATYCGHCGSVVPNDPVRAIALADKSYMVYRCSRCENETLLPTQ